MIRGFKKLLFLSFIFSFGLVSDSPSIAGMADKYREQNECNWNTAKYESLNGKRRYCVNRSGNIYVTNYRGAMTKLDGSFNRTTKKYEVYGNYSTLTEWKREGNKLIKYSCITENSSTSPDCSFTMDKDVVAYTLKEAKRRREIELDKEKALDKDKASRHKGDKKYKIGDYKGAISDYTIAINLDAINKKDAYFWRGVSKYKIGKFKGSISDLTSAIDLNSMKKKEAYFWRGLSKYKIGKFKGSISDYTIAINLDAMKKKEAYYYRGLSKRHLPDFQGACEDFRKSELLGLDVAKNIQKLHC